MSSASNEIPRLFALLIGINTYECRALPPLCGAVPDVKEFQAYLQTHLTVPADHISVLTDGAAKRAAIVQAFRDLSVDSRIQKGDAILIYYAGHGAEVIAPVNWESGEGGNKIQAIVPHDCNFFDGPRSQREVLPIPDRYLNTLLSNIAEAKGNNITVIFDCCHSASGTRELLSISKQSDVRVRTARLSDRPLPVPLDEASTTFNRKRSHEFWKLGRGLESHILIAACSSSEQAYEDNGHGRFTAAFLGLLRGTSPEDLRYHNILTHSKLGKIAGQTPYCEGVHKDRSLFNMKVLPARQQIFDVALDPKSGEGRYKVQGWSVHGLSKDSKLSIYRQNDINYSSRIGTLIVEQVYDSALSAIAKVSPGTSDFDTDTPTIAVRERQDVTYLPGLHIPLGDKFHTFLQNLPHQNAMKPFLDKVQSVADNIQDACPEIQITMGSTGNKISVKYTVDTTHGILSRYLNNAVAVVDPEPEKLIRVLSKLGNFYRAAKYHNNHPELSRCIVIEFFEVQVTSQGVQQSGQNLCMAGVVDLHVGNSMCPQLYGMKIINEWTQDLSVNIYRFNHHDLSISPVAEAHAIQNYGSELPLKKGGCIPIGYGASVYPPMSFKINEGRDTEVLFLKVYVATEVVDLSHLSQSPAFPADRAMVPFHPKPKKTWTDIIVPVVLSRRWPSPRNFVACCFKVL